MRAANSRRNWDGLGFSFSKTDEIFRAHGDTASEPVWSKGEYLPFGDVSISPAAAVLSYGMSFRYPMSRN